MGSSINDVPLEGEGGPKKPMKEDENMYVSCFGQTFKLKAPETMPPLRFIKPNAMKIEKWASVVYGCHLCNDAYFPPGVILVSRFH